MTNAAMDWLLRPPPMMEPVVRSDAPPQPEPAPTAAPEPAPTAASEPTSWADVDAALGPIAWAWERWLADGFLTILASVSGLGKSSLALRIAGCYTAGCPWPDGTPFEGERGRVLWCEAESAQALNLARCRAWGLDPRQILAPLPDGLQDVDLTNQAHRQAIARVARRDDVRLIVLDSLSGAVAGRRDENSSEMLQIVSWLSRLARDTHKPVIVTHHLRKKGLQDGDTVTLDRLRGSSAIVQVARLVWALDVPNPARHEALRLSVIKSNLAKFPEPLGLSINESGLTFTAAPKAEREPSAQEQAERFLLDLLSAGPVESADVLAAAQRAGISERTLKRAKASLWVQSVKDGGAWCWALPDDDFEDESA